MPSPKPVASPTQLKLKLEPRNSLYWSTKLTQKSSGRGPHSHSIAVLTIAVAWTEHRTTTTTAHFQLIAARTIWCCRPINSYLSNSNGLVKPAFDKQSLQLPISGKIKVADGTIVNAHGPVVVTMESAFSEHMIKCVATAASDRDLADHKSATLDKSLPCHTDQEKLDFALNKMTTKT
uniref:Uncharacterized protein n=1 Tax=Romanomermis culicivorax TaxID=13658 RepID=A0A915HHZ1_ROMCU